MPASSFEVGEEDKVDPEAVRKEGKAPPFAVNEKVAALQISVLKSAMAKSCISPTDIT